MEVLPDKKLAVSTRRGDIYLVEGAYDDPPTNVKFTKWATGMHEMMGLAYNPKDGYLYAVQRGEVTRLKDTHNRGKADVYETFCDGWGINGDYHEYPWMSKFDKDGNLYVLLTLTGSFTSDSEFRGWCLKITPDGKAVPFASGLRSPGGIGLNDKGELFYSDNQGPWNGGRRPPAPGRRQLPGPPHRQQVVRQGPQHGQPAPRPHEQQPHLHRSREDPPTGAARHHPALREAGPEPERHRLRRERRQVRPVRPPDVRRRPAPQQHRPLRPGQGQGPLPGRLLPLPRGLRLRHRADDAGRRRLVLRRRHQPRLGRRGPKEFSLERLVWTGKTPFEMYDMKLSPDGFDVTFTEPVDKATAGDAANYKLTTFRYIYRADYGSPEVDPTTATIKQAKAAPDGKSRPPRGGRPAAGRRPHAAACPTSAPPTASRCCTRWRTTRCGSSWTKTEGEVNRLPEKGPSPDPAVAGDCRVGGRALLVLTPSVSCYWSTWGAGEGFGRLLDASTIPGTSGRRR